MDSNRTPSRRPSADHVPSHTALRPRSEPPNRRAKRQRIPRTLVRTSLEALLQRATVLSFPTRTLRIPGIATAHSAHVRLRAVRVVHADEGWARGASANSPAIASCEGFGRVEAWLLEENEDELMMYGDWSTSYIVSGRRIEELDPFGRLLVGACKGKEDPRLLVDFVCDAT
jgi:hypothetical protein